MVKIDSLSSYQDVLQASVTELPKVSESVYQKPEFKAMQMNTIQSTLVQEEVPNTSHY